MNFQLLIQEMLKGTQFTVLIFLLTLLFSLPLGLIVSFGRMSKYKIIRYPVQLYLLIMRGTPLMLQLMFVFFGMPLIGIVFDRFTACIIAFSLNYAAYFAEIYRGGIESISQGQYEASRVLGFTRGQTFFKIVLPQVVKRILYYARQGYLFSAYHLCRRADEHYEDVCKVFCKRRPIYCRGAVLPDYERCGHAFLLRRGEEAQLL